MGDLVKFPLVRTLRARDRLEPGADDKLATLQAEISQLDAIIAALRYVRLRTLAKYRAELRRELGHPARALDRRRDEKLARQIEKARAAIEAIEASG
ncbi:MAG TPA: hypothetical protein VJ770_19800 [Stellaceae bacterium]|nr:hypothetical protein [Stellaceae bacterium]